MFDYKQRPFEKTLTDEQYDLAVGRKPSPLNSPDLFAPYGQHPCAETGCYWDSLPLQSDITKTEGFKRHVPPCPRAALDTLDKM